MGDRSLQSTSSLTVAVIGAGIVGLGQAWMAARQGHRVLLFERHGRAEGASIRNFGMLWPIGQPPGTRYRLARRSRELWLEAIAQAGLWHDPCGSLHLAYAEDEAAVLQEFEVRGLELGYDCTWLAPDAARRRSPAVRSTGLLGGLWSPGEICIDPREATRCLPAWLHQQYGVACHFGTTITQVCLPEVVASDGRVWRVDRVVVCGGADFELLYPALLARAGLRRCKLQMLRTAVQPHGWRMGTMLAGGLTLRHYRNFEVCPSLPALRQRIARETPELDRLGIHVMASQHADGRVTLGDSHEYDQSIEPFDREEIDALILRELQRLIDLPDWQITERWHGIYAQYPNRICLVEQPEPGVTIVNAPGGAGMTMSFGIAEQLWQSGLRADSLSE